MYKEEFWEIVQSFNKLMEISISGPDCTDPSICQGNCCGIQIDVPKILAKEYVKQGYASKDDFIRSNIFSFKLRFDNEKAKCFLFDPELNGCSIHKSGIKPPQCWIYPTKFTNESENISCKMADGWRIINCENMENAKELLEKYNSYCINEAKYEIKKIKNRIQNSIQSSRNNILKALGNYKPSELGGFQDTWDHIKPLPAEGISLQLKKFCEKYNNDCEFLPDKFLSCQQVCKKIAYSLIRFFETHIFDVIEEYGIDSSGKYPFHIVFEFLNISYSLKNNKRFLSV